MGHHGKDAPRPLAPEKFDALRKSARRLIEPCPHDRWRPTPLVVAANLLLSGPHDLCKGWLKAHAMPCPSACLTAATPMRRAVAMSYSVRPVERRRRISAAMRSGSVGRCRVAIICVQSNWPCWRDADPFMRPPCRWPGDGHTRRSTGLLPCCDPSCGRGRRTGIKAAPCRGRLACRSTAPLPSSTNRA